MTWYARRYRPAVGSWWTAIGAPNDDGILARCECGTERRIDFGNFKGGQSLSCGCIGRAKTASRNARAPGVSAFNQLFGRYARSARKRGLDFRLSRDEFAAITKQPCWYCGTAPMQVVAASPAKIANGNYVHNGIDRVDNAKGYVEGNCLPCCRRCNVAKGTMSQRDFLDMASRVTRCGLAAFNKDVPL